ncbi:unnamed protein product [Lactuca saligna]|uniref:Uncharacterized protein n=1 Tax=Lactuca saligna TaxID=75948 RepID=A0AA35VKV7_LACSI|nr:unnamed protein product [Lactuca saligna]
MEISGCHSCWANNGICDLTAIREGWWPISGAADRMVLGDQPLVSSYRVDGYVVLVAGYVVLTSGNCHKLAMNFAMESTADIVGAYVSGYTSNVDGPPPSRDYSGLIGLLLSPSYCINPLSIISRTWCRTVGYNILVVRPDGANCCDMYTAHLLVREG